MSMDATTFLSPHCFESKILIPFQVFALQKEPQCIYFCSFFQFHHNGIPLLNLHSLNADFVLIGSQRSILSKQHKQKEHIRNTRHEAGQNEHLCGTENEKAQNEKAHNDSIPKQTPLPKKKEMKVYLYIP